MPSSPAVRSHALLAVSWQPIPSVLFAISAALVVADVLGRCAVFLWHHDQVFGLVPLFELDREGNIPTWFQSSVLLLDALLVGLMAKRLRAAGTRFRGTDLVAFAIFLYLSVDEAAQIHEKLNFSVGTGPVAERAYYYTWLIPGLALLVFAAAAMRAFLQRLPRQTARGARLACYVFLAGAVGMEVVGGLVAMRVGPHNLGYAMMTCVEEGLEMAGMCQFAAAMLEGLATLGTEVAFRGPNREA